MKKTIITNVCVLIFISSFAQFGGGIGAESDPYRIYTIAHLEEIGDSLNLGNNLDNKHFRLMNDIVNDSLPIMLGSSNGRGFCGYFYGGGHILALNINSDDSYAALFGAIGGFEENVGYVDSLRIVGYLSSNYGGGGVCVNNYGTICRCTTKLQLGSVLLTFGGIAWENLGNIISCTNLTNTTTQQVGGICHRGSNYSNIVDCQNYGHFKIYGDGTGGICTFLGGGNIIGCINYGQISGSSDDITCNCIGGIVGQVRATVSGNENYRNFIMKCKNVGDIQSSDTYYMGGIVGDISGNVSIESCGNYGDVIGLYNVGGIAGRYTGNDSIWIMGEGYVYPSGRIVDCYNSGHIHGDSIVGGIAGTFASLCGDTLANCLNIGRVDGSAIYSGHYAFDGYEGFDFWGDSVYFDHNYYDAQMLADTSANEEGMYEWKLTSQLTGDAPELRAMLGDGWSYAEGRYPIPLGLENDSLAMLFATPIYLRVINDDNYDHTNLVRNNFTVGTENGVSWSSGDRLSIDGENATILASGSETATASLAGYSFSRSLRLDPITGELVATDCDSYLWNGDEYTASGDYIQVLTAANGCDSIVTLHLTINNSVHYSFTETATSPYIWNGTEYTETGDYTQNFTSANGCDSIVTLHLNILSGILQNGTAEISIYPNPATSTVSISCGNFSRATVIDMLGRIVIEVYDTTFDISGFRPGVYVVNVESKNGEIEKFKLVKE